MEEELLIEHVRAYPILYDLNIRYYRNQIARKEAWDEIGEKMGKPGDLCKDTWNKLRNAYTNAIKRRKTKIGQASKKMAKWVFEDQMSFLAITEAPRHYSAFGNSTGISQDGTQEQDDDADDPEALEAIADDTQPSQHQNVNELLSTDEPDIVAPHRCSNFQLLVTTQNDLKSKNTKTETSLSELALIKETNSRLRSQHLSINTASQACVHDEDEMFFLSLAKFVKKLNPSERIRVKSEVSQVVFQAEYRNLQTPEFHSQFPTDTENTEIQLVTNSSPVSESLKEPTEIKNEQNEIADCDYEIRLKLEQQDEPFNTQTNNVDFMKPVNPIYFENSYNSCLAVQNATQKRIDENTYDVNEAWKEPEIKIETVTPNDCCYENQIKPEENEMFDTQTNKKNVFEDIMPIYVEKSYSNCSAVQNDTQIRNDENTYKLGVNRKCKSAKSAAQRKRESRERKRREQEREQFKEFLTNTSFPLNTIDNEKYEAFLLLNGPKSMAQRCKEYRALKRQQDEASRAIVWHESVVQCEQERRHKNAVAAKEYRRRKKQNVDESMVLVDKPIYKRSSTAKSAAQRQRESRMRKRQEQERKQLEEFLRNTSFSSFTTDEEKYEAFLRLKKTKS